MAHLENIGSLSYADIPNVDTFYYTMFKKSYLLTSLQMSSETILTIGKLSSSWWWILILPWKLKFYHWEQTLSVVFLEMTHTHCSFLRNMSAKHSRLNNQMSISHSFQWKWYSEKRVSRYACNLDNCTSFFLLKLWHSAEGLMQTSHVVTDSIKKPCTSGLKCNKINNFYSFINDILKCNWNFLLTTSAWRWRTYDYYESLILLHS